MFYHTSSHSLVRVRIVQIKEQTMKWFKQTLFSLSLLSLWLYGDVAATIISPVNHTVIEEDRAMFQWSKGENIQGYYLLVQDELNGRILFNNFLSNTQHSQMVVNLPLVGSRIQATLCSQFKSSRNYECKETYYRPKIVLKQATIHSPSHRTLEAKEVTFEWDNGEGWDRLFLYVRNTTKNRTLFNQYVSGQSSQVVTVPTDGSTIEVILYSVRGYNWQGSVHQYKAGYLFEASDMVSPVPNTQLTGSSIVFRWSEGANVTDRRIVVSVGNRVIAEKILSGETTQTRIWGLPFKGEEVKVALHSIGKAAESEVKTYTYKAVEPEASELVSPVPYGTLEHLEERFEWTEESGIVSHLLYVKTASRFIGYAYTYKSTVATIRNIPLTGEKVYVSLYSITNNGDFLLKEYTYKTKNVGEKAAEITTPYPHSQLPSTTATFKWTQGENIQNYYLYIFGAGRHIFSNYVSATEQVVHHLPRWGEDITARLYSITPDNRWLLKEYRYKAAKIVVPSKISSPTKGTLLDSASVKLIWSSGVDVSQRNLYIKNDKTGQILFNQAVTGESQVVHDLPRDGESISVWLTSTIRGEKFEDIVYYKATDVQEMAKAFVEAYLGNDSGHMEMMTSKQMIEKLKGIDTKVRSYFGRIEGYYKMLYFQDRKALVIAVVEEEGEKREIKFHFTWAGDYWILQRIL